MSTEDWTESGVYQVAPGVHRVPLPLPGDSLRAVNVYLIDTGDGLVMVDGGWALPEARRLLEQAMATIGHDLGEISRILVTHMHRDHYTLAAVLRRLVGARVGLGAGERFALDGVNRLRTMLPVATLELLRRNGAADLADHLVGVMVDDFDPDMWEGPDDWLTAGDLPAGERTLRVIPTPGHTKGHVVFLDEQAGLLFAGDHVLPHITPSIGFEMLDFTDPRLPLADFLDSLRLMTTFADARLLPAHGPVTSSTHARVADLLAHHDKRLAQVADALGDITRDGHEVARRLTWTRRERSFADLDPFNQMLAVNETVAHLDLLVHHGQATVTVTDGVRWYQRTP